MAERVGGEEEGGGSSRTRTIAMVEDIQRRFIRPSLPRRDYSSSHRNTPGEIRIKKGKEQAEEKKLEDYLDPLLLAVISSKLRGKRNEREVELEEEEVNVKRSRRTIVEGFDWPPEEELRGFFWDDRSRGHVRRKGREGIDGAVNLGGEEVKEEKEDEEDDSRSPDWRRFEETVAGCFT